MTLTEMVKELALTNKLNYVNVAPAESLQGEPEWIRPADFLPGARSVISLGMKLGVGVQLANQIAYHRGPRHAIYSYLWHGFGLPSLHFIDRTALLVCRLLEDEGYIAVPVMSASTFDARGSIMEFSNIHAAVAAGLGELGYSGLALMPDVGPRVRCGAIITNAELEPDPLYEGPRLCDVEKCKKLGDGAPLCVSACPTKAIGADLERVVIGGRSFEVAKFDRFRCMWGSMGLSTKAMGLKDIPMPEQLGYAEIVSALKERDPNQVMETLVISRGDYCGQCIMKCPVGKPERLSGLL